MANEWGTAIAQLKAAYASRCFHVYAVGLHPHQIFAHTAHPQFPSSHPHATIVPIRKNHAKEMGDQDETTAGSAATADISADIKSGKYFSDALGWYHSVFTGQLKNPAGMFIFACAAAFTAVVMCICIYRAFPLTEKVTVVIPMTDTAEVYPTLVQVKSKVPAQQVITEHLCARYVIARESYVPNRMKPNYAFVLRSSEKAIFDKYYASLLATGATNPTNIRKLSETRKIKILSTNWQKDSKKVIILFEKNIYDGTGKFVSTSKWRADIEFYLSDYDWAAAKTAKIDFIVTSYETTELKDAPIHDVTAKLKNTPKDTRKSVPQPKDILKPKATPRDESKK